VDAGVVAALLTAIASLVGVLAVGFFQLRAARSEREAEAEKVLGRYRRPLAAAAYDLQRRLFNIIDPDPGFLGAYMTRRNEREIDAVESTLYRIAQYLAWTEILRRDIQFLDFREPEETRAVAELQAKIAHKFATDELPREFMLWQDEQRAIGELMIVRDHGFVDCLGYASFFGQRKKSSWPWLERLEKELRSGDARTSKRLFEIQHLLYELVELLDQDKVLDRSRLRRAQVPE
jgi:hypothetical protein